MSDLTDAQFAAYIDRILECRKAEDTAKEDTKQAYADLKDAGGDKTEAGLLVRALRMEEKDAGKAKAREEMLEEARLRYRRGKASHVRAREGSQSYAEAKGGERSELGDTVSALREVSRQNGTNFDGYDAVTRTFLAERELTDTQEQPETDCDYCADHVPAGEYWVCPRCDAEWFPEEDDNSNSPVAAPAQAIADDEAAQANPIVVGNLSNPQPTSSPAIADSPASTPSPEPGSLSEADVPAFLKPEQRKSIADYRPHCLNPDACGATGLTHCYTCRKAMEAASEAEAA